MIMTRERQGGEADACGAQFLYARGSAVLSDLAYHAAQAAERGYDE